MASQKYTTLAAGALATGYTAGDTTITLGTGQGATFPASGDYIVAVADPPAFFLRVTGRSGDVLTVNTAAVDGTSASTKGSGTAITHVITALTLDEIRSNQSGVGTRANLPSTGEAHKGDRYKCTDSQYEFIFDGTLWQPFIGGWNLVEPVLSDFSWVNQGSATASGTAGGIRMTAPTASGDNVRLLARAVPSAPYTITALILPSVIAHTNYQQCGIALYDSGSSKMSCFSILDNGGTTIPQCQVAANKMTSATSFSATYTAQNTEGIFAGPTWFRIVDDGTNRIYKWSRDGYYFETLYTVGRTDWLTPNMAGPYLATVNTSWPLGISVLSWQQG